MLPLGAKCLDSMDTIYMANISPYTTTIITKIYLDIGKMDGLILPKD